MFRGGRRGGSWLAYVALDQRYVTQAQFGEMYETAAETKRLIGGFIRYLQSPGKQAAVASP